MNLDADTIAWIEQKIDEVINDKGYGHVNVIWHIKDGKIDGIEKRTIQTKKPEGE